MPSDIAMSGGLITDGTWTTGSHSRYGCNSMAPIGRILTST